VAAPRDVHRWAAGAAAFLIPVLCREHRLTIRARCDASSSAERRTGWSGRRHLVRPVGLRHPLPGRRSRHHRCAAASGSATKRPWRPRARQRPAPPSTPVSRHPQLAH